MNKKIQDLLKIIPTKTIPISKIVFDKNNPNKMSESQVQALERVVTKYGFAAEPWLNEQKNGTYLVIDGEHRVKLLQEKGAKSVQAKIFKLKYSDIRILRQVANKLRGEHDKTQDLEEFRALQDDKLLTEFNSLMGKPDGFFEQIVENNSIDFPDDNIEIDTPDSIQHRCVVKDCDHGQQ